MEWSNEIGLEVEMISFVRSAGIPQQMISHMTESESGLGPLQGDMKGQVLEKNKRGGFFIIRVVFDLRCYGRGKLNINLLLLFFSPLIFSQTVKWTKASQSWCELHFDTGILCKNDLFVF